MSVIPGSTFLKADKSTWHLTLGWEVALTGFNRCLSSHSDSIIQLICVAKGTGLGLVIKGGANRAEGPMVFIQEIVSGGDCQKVSTYSPLPPPNPPPTVSSRPDYWHHQQSSADPLSKGCSFKHLKLWNRPSWNQNEKQKLQYDMWNKSNTFMLFLTSKGLKWSSTVIYPNFFFLKKKKKRKWMDRRKL